MRDRKTPASFYDKSTFSEISHNFDDLSLRKSFKKIGVEKHLLSVP